MDKVLIVGAGVSGLMAACELGKAGFEVTVIEALPRIGGRINTLREGFSLPVEGGAEFIHGNVPATLSLVQEARLETHEVDGRNWHIYDGALQQKDWFDTDWPALINAFKKLEEDVTMSVFLDRFFSHKKYGELRKAVKNLVEGYDAADLDKVSAFALRDEWTKGDDSPQYRLSQGYRTLVQYLYAKCEASGVQFEMNAPVESINWSEGKVSVQSPRGHWEGRYTIITVSIGVIQENKIRIIPPLVEYNAAARNFGFGGVIKFLFEFKTRIWEGHSAFRQMPSLGFLLSDASIPTWWTQSPENSTILTGWLAGPAATKYSRSTKEELFAIAAASLCYLFACKESTLFDSVRHYDIVNWSADEHFFGAYAYATPQTREARKTLNTPVVNTLFFAGEALYDGPEMGTVEAALASGKRVAKMIAG